jgi:hypothetical protein
MMARRPPTRTTRLLFSILPLAALAAVLPAPDRTPVPFRRIVLVENDGSRIAVEEDGEVWRSAPLTKRLVQTLTSGEMGAMASALARARVADWEPGDATGAFGRSRIAVLFISGETRSTALPPPGFEGERLLALLRALASGT